MESLKDNSKQCTTCKQWFPATTEYFYMRNKKKPEKGLNAECNECAREKARQYARENKERKAVWFAKWYRENKEAKLASNRQWYKDNLERWLEFYNEYKQLDYVKEKLKQYNNNRREKHHDINTEEWQACKNYFDNCCAYCGFPIEDHKIRRKGEFINIDLHKEHVILDGKNDLRNCVPSCQQCNSEKSIHSLNNWYNPDNPKYTYERYYKIYMWLRYDHKKYIQKKKPKQKYTKRQK